MVVPAVLPLALHISKEERAELVKQAQEEHAAATSNGGNNSKLKIRYENLTRMIGARWKRLGPAQRSLYEQRAAQDKIRYASQLLGYKERKKHLLEARWQRQKATISEAAMKKYLERQGQATMKTHCRVKKETKKN